MSDSIWSDGGRIQMPQYEKLTRIKKVDVTIVGGGLCGLLCAYFLKEAGVECLLLEGSRIGSGTVRQTCDGTGYVAAWPYIQQIAGNFGGREGPHVL